MTGVCFTVCFTLCVLVPPLTNRCCASSSEERLREHLFPPDYNQWALPNKNASDVLFIWFGLAISQIVDVDEKKQVLTSKVWMKQMWHDYHFTWDPADFGNITNIKVPSPQIWIPDIMIYNNANGTYDMKSHAWANIYFNGTVFWFPPAVYKSACKIDVQYFPFDEQKCVMKFGSWSYDHLKIDLIPVSESAEKKDYWENGEWTIVQSPAERHAVKYPCCEDIYVDVTYYFVLRRKPLFYFAYLLLPCGIISFNTVLVFYLPPDITGKMSLCTSVLLSMVWFLLLVTQCIPSNANSFPLIVKYLLFTMTIVASSIVLTVFVLNIRHRSPYTHIMPQWVRTVFVDLLPRFVGLQRPNQKRKRELHHSVNLSGRDSIAACNHIDAMMTETSSHSSEADNDLMQAHLSHQSSHNYTGEKNSRPKENNAKMNAGNMNPAVEPLLNCMLAQKNMKAERFFTPFNEKNNAISHYIIPDELTQNTHSGHGHSHVENNIRSSSHTPTSKKRPRPLLQEEPPLQYMVAQQTVEDIMYLTSRSINNEYATKAREEWKIVAMVIDRIFLIIYLCAVFIGTLSIVLEAPLARDFFMDILFRNGTTFSEDSAEMNEACSTYFPM
ncbi:neuronal acetylcholine receptor subunit alpha-2-like [Lytechinus pictus]|uniref:neuronal acetylcholine receptor subunit alpha-2-like n=1 Tax=Lytechinus pictus TaxID=7653 RepID=UPI00240D09D8|nr:neuronal acetylcholine receptor subunit alpha-2-like [Lytechinus pictus]